jgi:hypothetical protein
MKTGFSKQFSGIADLDFKLYSSDNDPATLTTNLDKSLTAAGYKFGIPGMTAPMTQGSATIGLYTKAGSPDLFVIIGDPNAGLGMAGLDANNLKTVAGDLSSKKGLIILVSGTGLLTAFMGAGSGSGSSSATTTAVAMTTTAAAGGSSSGMSFTNATEVPLSSAISAGLKSGFSTQFTGINDLDFKIYASSDDPATFTTAVDTALTGAGYKFGIPGMTAPMKQGAASLGLYTKSGSPDLFVIIGDPNAGLGMTGLDATTLKTVAGDLSSKKGIMILVSGTGLLTAFMSAGANMGGSSSATTTAAGGSSSATTTAVAGGSSSSGPAMSFANANEVTINATVLSAMKGAFQSQFSSITDLGFQIYASTEDAATFATTVDTALTGGGYKFGIPGMTAPMTQGSATIGLYTKSGSPDLFVIIGDPSVGLGVSGLDATTLKTVAGDLSSKKGIMILVSGTGLLTAFMGAAGSGSSSTTPTTAP